MSLIKVKSRGTDNVSGRKNLIINGNFQVFQRGSGGATASNNAYAKTDRFKYFSSGVTTTQDQQEFTPGQTDIPGEPEYYMRNILASNSSAGDYSILAQHIEDVRTCAGQEVTLSFYAKSSVNGNKFAVEFNQHFGTGGSSRATSAQTGDTASLVTLTTSWAKYTVTTTIDSISGKTLGPSNTSYLELYLWMSGGSTYNGRSNSLGNQSGNFDIANIQLEIGNSASDFEHRSFGEELSLCQRYYFQKINGNGQSVGMGTYISSTQLRTYVDFPTIMRATPSIVTSNDTNHFNIESPSDSFNGNWIILQGNANSVIIYSATSVGGTTSYSGAIRTTSADARLAFSAEN